MQANVPEPRTLLPFPGSVLTSPTAKLDRRANISADISCGFCIVGKPKTLKSAKREVLGKGWDRLAPLNGVAGVHRINGRCSRGAPPSNAFFFPLHCSRRGQPPVRSLEMSLKL